MSLSSVSSESSSLSGIPLPAFPPLKKWADCHELHEKIAFIVGNTKLIIGYLFSAAASAIGNLGSKVSSMLPFGAIGKFFLDTFNMACATVSDIANKIGPLADKAIGNCINGIANFCHSVKQLLALNEISRFAIAIFNAANHGLHHCFKWLSETILTDVLQHYALSFSQSCENLLNRTIVPLWNNISAKLNSYADRVAAIFSRIECRCLGQCSEGLESIAKLTVVPLYKRVIFPICKTLGDISYGICHGCCGRQAPEEDDEIHQKKNEENNKLKKA